MQKAISSARRSFLDGLGARLDRFDDLMADLDLVGDRQRELDQLCAGAHSISGVAAMLGFKTLGEAARAADEAIRNYRASDEPVPADLIRTIEVFLIEVDLVLEEQSPD